MMVHVMLLLLAQLGVAAAAPVAAPTSSPPPPVAALPRPASLASCRALGYCNSGSCSLLPDQHVSCACSPPFVDSAAGLCSARGKSKTVAVLLSLFLGWSGADWFYLSGGNTEWILMGFLKLATFAIPALWLASAIHSARNWTRTNEVDLHIALGFASFIWWFLNLVALARDEWQRRLTHSALLVVLKGFEKLWLSFQQIRKH
jgi:hypothetical protein